VAHRRGNDNDDKATSGHRRTGQAGRWRPRPRPIHRASAHAAGVRR